MASAEVGPGPEKRVTAGVGKTRQLNGFDSLLLYVDSKNAFAQGGFLQIYAPVTGEDATTRYQRLLRHIEHRLDITPSFRRAIMRSPFDLDHAWFVDGVDVDLSYHVRHLALPQPGSAEQLNDIFASICMQPMDINRPLWEIHVIDGINGIAGIPGNAFALVMKFHHAAVDGGAAAEITAALHRTDARRESFKLQPHRYQPLPSSPPLQMALLRTVGSYARLGLALGREMVDQLPTLSISMAKRLLAEAGLDKPAPRKPGMSVPTTIFNVEVSTHRAYSYLSFNLDAIKRIRQQVPGATVNDVYLAVVGGAFRRYLQERKALPEQSLVAGVSVNVRNEDERGQGGNQVAVIRVPLRTDESGAARRLQLVVDASTRAKASVKGEGGRKSASWFKMLPSPLLLLIGNAMGRAKLGARVRPFFNVMVTNVPGPRETLYLDGARMLDFTGTPPLMHGVGLIFNATSYENSLKVGL